MLENLGVKIDREMKTRKFMETRLREELQPVKHFKGRGYSTQTALMVLLLLLSLLLLHQILI